MDFVTQSIGSHDFEDGHCPTFDFSIRLHKVNGKLTNSFKFYEKPTSTPYTIMSASAMSQVDKISTLSQEASRRLERMSEDRTQDEKNKVLEECDKENSTHCVP